MKLYFSVVGFSFVLGIISMGALSFNSGLPLPAENALGVVLFGALLIDALAVGARWAADFIGFVREIKES